MKKSRSVFSKDSAELFEIVGEIIDLGVDERLETEGEIDGLIFQKFQRASITHMIADPLCAEPFFANLNAALREIDHNEPFAVLAQELGPSSVPGSDFKDAGDRQMLADSGIDTPTPLGFGPAPVSRPLVSSAASPIVGVVPEFVVLLDASHRELRSREMRSGLGSRSLELVLSPR
jgi:hypothetical protein